MIFAKLDVDITDHPKAIEAGPAAFGLWAWSLAYCRKHELDGRIPTHAVRLALGASGDNGALADRLVEVGLWGTREGGWTFLNYAKKNETKSQIDDRKALDRTRKAESRAHSPRKTLVRVDTLLDNFGIPTVAAAGIPGSGSGSVLPSLDPDLNRTLLGTEPPAPSKPARVAKVKHRFPESLVPASDEEAPAWCAQWRIPPDHPELPQFLDTHRKKESRWRDWTAAWRTWERRVPRYATERDSGTWRAGTGPRTGFQRGPVPDTPPAPYHAPNPGYRPARADLETDQVEAVGSLLARLGGSG